MSGIPGYEAALNAATMSVRSLPSVRHPWETNKVMRQIFRSGRFPSDEGDPQVHISGRFSEHLASSLASIPQTAIADRDYIFEDELDSDGQSHCSDGAASAPSVGEVRTIEHDSIEKGHNLRR